MQIVLLVVGAAIGALASWAVTHAYHMRAAREQRLLFAKLSKEVRDAILADTRVGLSVTELNQLLAAKTIDPADEGPLPFVACPKCGSEDLDYGGDVEVDVDSHGLMTGTPYDTVRCNACGWYRTEIDEWKDGNWDPKQRQRRTQQAP